MKVFLWVACAMVSGCGVQASLVRADASVVVVRSDGILKAQPVAEAECQKQKLHAQWVDTRGDELNFRCLPR